MANETKFTNEQENAIVSVGNVIVSAGAGSGKTTVLTERVRRNVLGIIQDQVPVKLDELLILTFTNDAASSMKAKIKGALKKEDSLKHLVPFVDSAHIETFDAYAQFIVTKYGHYENYPKNISIIEDDILTIKSASFLDEILENLYEKEDETLGEIIFLYCTKGDKNFVSFLRSIFFNILVKKDDPIAFLKQYKSEFLQENFFKNILDRVDEFVKETVDKIRNDLSSISTLEVRTKLIDGFGELFRCQTARDLATYKPTFEKFDAPKFTQLKKDIRHVNKTIGHKGEEEIEILDEMRENYKILYNLAEMNFDTFLEKDIHYQIKYLGFIIDEILIPLIMKIQNFKFSTGFFSFSDVAKMATTIVKNHEAVRNELKNQYKLIMIDEYQDTSDTQEEFINLIANENVFSVGDIKQSIYRFRGAKPDLFKRKYDLYKNEIDGKAVNMNKNFRSRKEIINPINIMFSNLMTENFGGAEYKLDHIIDAANTNYDKYGLGKFEHGMFQISHSNYLLEDPSNMSSGKGKLTEANARLIAYDIKNRIKMGYEVYDKEAKTTRKARYSDFTILTYKSTKFSTFEKIFKEYDIPLNAIYDDSIRNDISIIIISNLFKLLYLLGLEETTVNQKGEIKHLLISLFRSYIFNYSDQELYDLFNENKYTNDPNYIKLSELAKKYKNEPLHEIYIDIFKELDYLDKSSSLKNVLNSIDKNNIFYNKTKTMDKLGYTLNDLSSYIKDADTLDVKMDQTIYSEATDAVTLTTVHKSKGLEYPLVYLPCLRDFNAPKLKNNGDYYLFDNSFFLPLFSDPKKEANLLGLGMVKTNDSFYEDAEERLRLLYVALTRAEEDIVYINDYDDIFDNETLVNRLTNEFSLKFEKNEVNDFDNAVDAVVQERMGLLKSIRNGRSFDDFLRSSDMNFPLSNFMDKAFGDLFATINKYVVKNKFDFNEDAIYILVKDLINIYEQSNFTFDGFDFNLYVEQNYDIALTKVKEAEKKTEKAEYETHKEIAFEGVKQIGSDRLIKMVAEIINGKVSIEATLYPNIVRNFTLDSIEEYREIIDEIKNDNFCKIAQKLKLKNIVEEEELIKFNALPSPKEKFIFKEVHIEPIIVEKTKKASKDVDDSAQEDTLVFGTHMHALLESVDLVNPDLTIISDIRERDLVSKAIDKLQSLNLSDARIFKEYQFSDTINNVNGVIDLLLLKKDTALIIDYKLKNIDDVAYIKQLAVYKTYVSSAFNITNIECYLLSIIDGNLVKIEV